jgi:hypothetical protein
MHVLGNAEPTENVALHNQFMGAEEDIEIHRARQVNHQANQTLAVFLLQSVAHGSKHILIFLTIVDCNSIPWAKIMVWIFLGHEDAENTYP